MLDFLAQQPLFALVIILAVGLALGKVSIAGVSLGAAAVLFVALGLSTANPDISIPPLVYQMGLAMFVYVIGLSAGPTFFREFRTRGWRLNLFTALLIVVLLALGYALIKALALDPLSGAGMFAGALSSTPGMAAIVEMVDAQDAQAPVVGYSLAYPGAVLGMIVVAAIGARVLRVNHRHDAEKEGLLASPLVWRGVRITREGVRGRIHDLPAITGQKIIATRIISPEGSHQLADPAALIQPGMTLIIHGTEEAVTQATQVLGEGIKVGVEDTELAFKLLTVSHPQVVGVRLADLDTVSNGFLIARIRRGDNQIVPRPDTTLQYSDRIRVIAAPGRMKEVRAFVGDSEKALGNVDLFPFALGLAIGLGLGLIPIPLPGGQVLTLGFGGGPIVAGLILGALDRTGPIRWQLPFHANHTISTLGLSLFLAGVGTSAGAGFRTALGDPSSLMYIVAGAVITLVAAVVAGTLGRKILRLTWDESMGVAAGLSTNPAVLSYLNTQTGTELAARGHATVYPTAMIGKIIAAQVLLMLVV